MAKICNVVVKGDKIVIEHWRTEVADTPEHIELTFGDVKLAAQVLREHLLSAIPVEIPKPLGEVAQEPKGELVLLDRKAFEATKKLLRSLYDLARTNELSYAAESVQEFAKQYPLEPHDSNG